MNNGMTGMLWFEEKLGNDSLDALVAKAVKYFEDKYGKPAETVHLSPILLTSSEPVALQVTVNDAQRQVVLVPNIAIRPKYMWVNPESRKED